MGECPAPLSDAAWSFACPDWEDRLRAGRSPFPDLPLDLAAAERAVRIFNNLRLPDVPGQPKLAEAAGEWQRDIVRAIFGSLDPETRRRRVAEVLALIPKKNSKTTFGAAIALTFMLINERPNADALLIGPTQEVADLAYQQARGMIEADETGYLGDRFHCADHLKTITDRRNGARLKIKTFDTRVMTGSKPIFALLDELHVMSAYSYASKVVAQIRGGFVANPESLFVMITTQSDDIPAGVFKDQLQQARGVRDGRLPSRRMLPVLYEFSEAVQSDEAQPWADPANWPQVLPNLGRSITLDRLIEEFQSAKEKGEHEVRLWASQHLNVEIGLALHAARWRGADHWPKAKVEGGLTLEQLIARCEVIVAGVDGGGLDDLLGLNFTGRERGSRDWLSWSRAWVQEEVLDLRPEIAERLRDFDSDGDLVLCRDARQDVEQLADLIAQVHAAGLLPEANAVGLDPAGVSAIVDALAERGIAGAMIIGVPQGYRLSGAVWGMERRLKNGQYRHAGQPLMSWCVGNAKPEQQGNAVLITKAGSGKAKIDPLMAAFDAFQLMSRNPEASGGSVDYDKILAEAAVT